jgi:hypothetical protein
VSEANIHYWKLANRVNGTEGGTRTLKVAKPADFESAASTNSATSAQGRDYKQIRRRIYSRRQVNPVQGKINTSLFRFALVC